VATEEYLEGYSESMTRRLIVHAYGAADSDALTTALRVARHSAQELENDVDIQIVVQGPAVKMLVVGSSYAEELASTTASAPIEVFACENSMKAAGVVRTELLTLVDTVPAAVAYIAQQQWEGSAYVRF
jgi:intracellular sulfur oxidation DsrE/DsrF family protein